MDFNYTRSNNAIAKSAQVLGPQYIVNQGYSVIGAEAEICGDRNNGRPIISWGRYVILDTKCRLAPGLADPAAEKVEYIPLRIGNYVYIGANSVIEAASIGSCVIIGTNCRIGTQAVIRSCTVIPDNSVVPPHGVVGPLTRYTPTNLQQPIEELPESAEDAIKWFCEMKFLGIESTAPF